MIGYITSAFLMIVIVVLLILHDREKQEFRQCYDMLYRISEKLGEQKEQLISIIKRTNAELVVDKDGNYDALIPITPEELEEFKRQIRERNP